MRRENKLAIVPVVLLRVSESAAEAIADIAATLGAPRLILGAPRHNALINILRGNLVREVSDLLPEETDLLFTQNALPRRSTRAEIES
jgi:hypothetical protein